MRALIVEDDLDTGALVCSDVVISPTADGTVFAELGKYTLEGSPFHSNKIRDYGIAYRHASGEIRLVITEVGGS